MQPTRIVIEDGDGDGGIRLPDEVLQELGVEVEQWERQRQADAGAQDE